MRRLWVAGLAVAALVAVTAFVLHDSSSSIQEAADELVADGVPGVVVRVRDGGDVLELAAGEATADERLRVGSVTKTFVAALTLRLAAAGVLSLDDPVARFEPGLLTDGDRITLRDLLDHTAGLFDYTSDPRLLREDRPPRELVAIANRRERTEGYAYSSTNYLVLGLVLEAAARAPLGGLLRSRVFGPAGLGETTFEPGRVTGPHLHGHERSLHDGVATGGLRDTSARSARSAWAAGAVVSTAADLDRFFRGVLAGDLGERMRPAPGARYGLGLARFQTPCGPVVGHTGNLLGTVTVAWARDQRVLVAAANLYPLTPEQETDLRLLLERAFCS
jgi:D-alanyl-D-alanine carboxypeptidase